jgi:transposase
VHARTTVRLRDTHCSIGFALGGEAGARLARTLAMPTSPDTLLRRIRNAAQVENPVPRILGIDDWAWRKGTRYGTILCDLERGRVVDLLPDRTADTVAAWLQTHPGVAIVSRDRAGPYAQGVRLGAPQAVQVADRWHLLCNVREALERLLDRQRGSLRAAAQEVVAVLAPTQEPAPLLPVPDPPPVVPSESPCPNRQTMRQQVRRQRRCERYLRVRELHQQQVSVRQIARDLDISRRTVRCFLRAATFPERAVRRAMPTPVDRFAEYIRRRCQEGCQSAAELYQELKAQGCPRSYETVRRYIERRGYTTARGSASTTAPSKPKPVVFEAPSPRRASWWLLGSVKELQPQERNFVEKLRQQDAEINGAVELAAEFGRMVRERQPSGFVDWLRRVEQHGAPEMRSMAGSMRQDQAAVAAGLELPWSTGPVEGQINRLKMLKRQMYGRANFELLRQRVLHAN